MGGRFLRDQIARNKDLVEVSDMVVVAAVADERVVEDTADKFDWIADMRARKIVVHIAAAVVAVVVAWNSVLATVHSIAGDYNTVSDHCTGSDMDSNFHCYCFGNNRECDEH